MKRAPVGSYKRGDVTIVGALVAVGIAVPAAISIWLGAFDIPRNDSWSYRRVLWEFVQTGHVHLVGWSGMTMVGQVFWAYPFTKVLGSGQWVPGVAVAVASAIGVLAAYALARSVLPRAWSGVCVLLTLAVPGMLLNTSSFMTDVTALSAQTVCLALGAAALHRAGSARLSLLATSLAAGCFGFSIREFDLAAPVAVLVVLAAQDRRGWRLYLASGFCLLAICGAVYVWTAQLPGAHLEGLSWPSSTSLRQLLATYFTLSFVLAPVLPVVLRPAAVAHARRGALAALVMLALGTLSLAKGWGLFVGNYLMQQGVTGAAVLGGGRPNLFPGWLWLALQVVAVGAGCVLAFVAVSAGTTRQACSHFLAGNPRSMIAWFALLSAGGLLAYGLFVKAPLFDRYLGPIVFPVAVLLAASHLGPRAGRHRPGARTGAAQPLTQTTSSGSAGTGKVVAAALAIVVGTVNLALVLNADAYDGARWKAGELAVQAGFAPSVIDAGFEWVGTHSADDADRALQARPGPNYEQWYDKLFADFRDCAFVSGSPWQGPGLELLRTTNYDELGFAVPEHLWIYSAPGPRCSASRRGATQPPE